MQIVHLFKKVYLSFDIMFQPVFDTLVVSEDYYSPHSSFINNHMKMGYHHGKFTKASEVSWSTFFNNVSDRRTMVYASPENFAVIYFSFLKTIKPFIKKTSAVKILEIILKRNEFIADTWSDLRDKGIREQKKAALLDFVAKVRTNFDKAWILSKSLDLDKNFVEQNLGIEMMLARYWADGREESVIIKKLEQMIMKTLVVHGQEFSNMYATDWLHRNPGADKNVMDRTLQNDPKLSWICDPYLSEKTLDQFFEKNDWTVLHKIYEQIFSPSSVAVSLMPHQWRRLVNRDWLAILDKKDPLTVLALFSEAPYKTLVNGWLISYFAAQNQQTLKEMVI